MPRVPGHLKNRIGLEYTCSYITLSIKTKLTSKLETGIYFLKILMSLKKVLEMFLIVSVMEHVEIKFN